MCSPIIPKAPIRGKLSYDFLSLFVEKNTDKTRNLRLKGNELIRRIGRRINDADIYAITGFLSTRPDITNVQLSYNDITDDGFKILIDGLLRVENFIMHLSIIGCDITHVGVTNLSSAWETLKLKTLRFTGNKLGCHAGPALETLLLKLPTLQHLDVGDTNQDLKSVPYYCSSLRSDIGGNTTLKTFDISTIIPMSEYYQYPPSHLADQLGEMIKMNFTLVEFHAQKCQFDGHDVELLLLGLRKNTTLLLLDIGYNRINNFGAELLAKWLETKPNLLGLNIAGNSIGYRGGVALSVGLPFSKLRLLDISQNIVPDLAVAKILKTIKKKVKLRQFYIWGNNLGPFSLKILERQIKAGIYEQENIDVVIYFADNRLQAAQYPANMYKYNYYCKLLHNEVQELRIKRNKISSEFCEKNAKVLFNHYNRIEGERECADNIQHVRHERHMRCRCADDRGEVDEVELG